MNYYDSAYIGQLAVLPEFQRMGVGSALVQHALAWMKRTKVPSALLDASKEGFPRYTRLGFTLQDTTSLYALNQPTNIQADCGWCSILQLEELHELAAFDAAVFPGDRSRLLNILQRDHSFFIHHEYSARKVGLILSLNSMAGMAEARFLLVGVLFADRASCRLECETLTGRLGG